MNTKNTSTELASRLGDESRALDESRARQLAARKAFGAEPTDENRQAFQLANQRVLEGEAIVEHLEEALAQAKDREAKEELDAKWKKLRTRAGFVSAFRAQAEPKLERRAALLSEIASLETELDGLAASFARKQEATNAVARELKAPIGYVDFAALWRVTEGDVKLLARACGVETLCVIPEDEQRAAMGDPDAWEELEQRDTAELSRRDKKRRAAQDRQFAEGRRQTARFHLGRLLEGTYQYQMAIVGRSNPKWSPEYQQQIVTSFKRNAAQIDSITDSDINEAAEKLIDGLKTKNLSQLSAT